MIYDDNHKMDFEGAVGICSICGLRVILDRGDRPFKELHTHTPWNVRCPHCHNIISCFHVTEGENEV